MAPGIVDVPSTRSSTPATDRAVVTAMVSPAGVTVTSIELDAPPSEAVKVTTVGVAAGATRGRTSVGAAQVGSTIFGVLVVSSTSTAPCGPLLITVRKAVALVDPRPSITVAMPRGALRAVGRHVCGRGRRHAPGDDHGRAGLAPRRTTR